jgi:hypothetical protein
MSAVLVAQPLLLVMPDLAGRTGRSDRRPLPSFGGASGNRVTLGSARRVSPAFQGSGVSQEGHVSRAASAGAPHAGHLRAELTGEF